jgi:signal peptidase I
VNRIITHTMVALACIALVVPGVLMATGALPYRIFIVHTGSMSPTIPSNSAVIVRKGMYAVGQVITFETPNGVVTHRLIDRKVDGNLVTKGDANQTPDPGTVSPSDVIGGVVAAPPMIGYWLTYLKNPLGLGSVAAALVVVWLLCSTAASLFERREQARA